MEKHPYRIAPIHDINGVLWYRCEKLVKHLRYSGYFPIELGWSGAGVRQDAVFLDCGDAVRYLKLYALTHDGRAPKPLPIYFNASGVLVDSNQENP